jgi:hypothetical protein
MAVFPLQQTLHHYYSGEVLRIERRVGRLTSGERLRLFGGMSYVCRQTNGGGRLKQ